MHFAPGRINPDTAWFNATQWRNASDSTPMGACYSYKRQFDRNTKRPRGSRQAICDYHYIALLMRVMSYPTPTPLLPNSDSVLT
ncbi:hypothetical protein AB0758_33080 [Tolypothrix bouteillei VB521301_2]|uniref:Uncharacterized protein n=1 Tax=Tolypothrix bouteillei VB521301 TaxID=1479485 RepID=A0A8S9SXS9_9CYAN|nr:hypothetical protein [Tolypothrix bouteillei]KAF3884073.1 hypothetical protein DA73_0400000070 [Tolypothrix bouteillei VB521301]